MQALLKNIKDYPRNLWNEARAESGWKFLLLLAICLAVFCIFKNTALRGAEGAHLLSIPVACVFALLGMRVKMSDIALPMRIVLYTTLGLFTLYILAAHATFDVALLPSPMAYFFEPGRYVFALICLAALWRPSLGLIAITYVIFFKKIGVELFKLVIPPTDYMPLIEMSGFFIIVGIIWHYLRQREWWAAAETKGENTLDISQKLFLAGIASHMINYYYSALAKVKVGDHWYDWIIHNKTYFLLLTSDALGQLPISFSDELLAFTYRALELLIVPTNALLFFGQILAIVALLRIRWGIIAMLFYDLTHVIIFVTSGIFFYKWIALNLSIVLALRTMRQKVVSPLTGMMTILIVIFGTSLFFTARLGWWDTPAMNIEYFSAVTKDGRDVRIPSNYWGNMSVTAGQQRLIWGKTSGFLATQTYGITMDQRVMEKAQYCDLPVGTQGKESAVATYFANPKNDLTTFVRTYHHWAVERGGEDGRFLYDAFPHHIFSMPWEFMEFYHLNLKDVVAYRYNLKATCTTFEDGKYVTRVIKEEHHDIPVR